eukprot:557469-Pyramimonas_sp.AAC.1
MREAAGLGAEPAGLAAEVAPKDWPRGGAYLAPALYRPVVEFVDQCTVVYCSVLHCTVPPGGGVRGPGTVLHCTALWHRLAFSGQGVATP